jgi:hypothetical protein
MNATADEITYTATHREVVSRYDATPASLVGTVWALVDHRDGVAVAYGLSYGEAVEHLARWHQTPRGLPFFMRRCTAEEMADLLGI